MKKVIESLLAFFSQLLSYFNLALAHHGKTSLNREYFFFRSKTVQHAVSTPLTILKLNLERLLEGNKDQTASLISQSLQAVNRVEGLLKLASLESKTSYRTVFDVHESLVELTLLFTGFKQIHIALIKPEKINIKLHGSKVLFQEALSCLINNAAEAYSSRVRHKSVLVFLHVVKKKLRLEVVDFGCGMTSWQQSQALLPGISSKPRGMGIGLGFAKRTFEYMFKGEMKILSDPEVGTRVIVQLPIKSR